MTTPDSAGVPSEIFSLKGKTAIVTGASRGIGEAIDRGFAQAGTDLVLVSRNKEALEKLAADIGIPEEIQKTVETSLHIIPHIDILVNNAGISPVLKRRRHLGRPLLLQF